MEDIILNQVAFTKLYPDKTIDTILGRQSIMALLNAHHNKYKR